MEREIADTGTDIGLAPGLIAQLTLVPSGHREWSGTCETGAAGRLFGGQVIAQAVVAAAADLADDSFSPRSVHAHFLRPGTPGVPVVHQITVLTDGRSFATQQVTAVQREAGRPERNIATAVVAFHRPERSTEHQLSMPRTSPASAHPAALIPPATNPRVRAPFELRSVPEAGATDPTRKQMWIRSREPLGTDQTLVAAALTWIADFSLPWSTDAPHAHEPGPRAGASLDHTLWFHRHTTLDDWLLLDQTSPVYTGARGLSLGHFYDRDGAMVASAVQESLLRRPQ